MNIFYKGPGNIAYTSNDIFCKISLIEDYNVDQYRYSPLKHYIKIRILEKISGDFRGLDDIITVEKKYIFMNDDDGDPNVYLEPCVREYQLDTESPLSKYPTIKVSYRIIDRIPYEFIKY